MSHQTVLVVIWSSLLVTTTLADPHGLYYGRQQQQSQPRTNLQLSASYSNMLAHSSLRTPSCGQLRTLWRATANELSSGVADTPNFPSKPYYLNMLLREEPRFGKIVNSPPATLPANKQHRPGLAGHFDEYSLPGRELGSDYAFGEVVGGSGQGKFGAFDSDKQQQQQWMSANDVRSKMMSTARPTATQVKHSGPLAGPSDSSSGSGSGRISASDFFSGMWHDKPVKI